MPVSIPTHTAALAPPAAAAGQNAPWMMLL